MKATGKSRFTQAVTRHLIAWSILLVTLWPLRVPAQETVVVGIPRGAENALEFVMRSDQDGGCSRQVWRPQTMKKEERESGRVGKAGMEEWGKGSTISHSPIHPFAHSFSME